MSGPCERPRIIAVVEEVEQRPRSPVRIFEVALEAVAAASCIPLPTNMPGILARELLRLEVPTAARITFEPKSESATHPQALHSAHIEPSVPSSYPVLSPGEWRIKPPDQLPHLLSHLPFYSLSVGYEPRASPYGDTTS